MHENRTTAFFSHALSALLQHSRFTFPVYLIWIYLYLLPGNQPYLQQWDEARNAINALEMQDNGHYLVRYFNGAPDMYELKPPMLVWLQAFSVKLLGISEFAVRFPSMLAALLLALLLFRVLVRSGLSVTAAAVAASLLLCVPAAAGPHAFGFGDHDALLCLWQALLFYEAVRYFETGSGRHLRLAALAFVAGWMTKSIAIAFVLPGLLLPALLISTCRRRLFSWQLIAAAGAALTLIAGYYLLREQHSPGYLKLVMQEEWLGRYRQPGQNDNGYYVQGFLHGRFGPLALFMAAAIPFSLFSIKHRGRMLWGVSVFITTLLIISFSGSKNFWYDLPLLFPGVFTAALMVNSMDDICKTRLHPGYSHSFTIIMSVSVFWMLRQGAEQTRLIKTDPPYRLKKDLLLDAMHSHPGHREQPTAVFTTDHQTDLQFYARKINARGGNIRIIQNAEAQNGASLLLMYAGDSVLWKTMNPSGGLQIIYTADSAVHRSEKHARH